jgi:hypothetical protein
MPSMKGLHRFDYVLALSEVFSPLMHRRIQIADQFQQHERLEVEFLKFATCHPKIEEYISSEQPVKILLLDKKQSTSLEGRRQRSLTAVPTALSPNKEKFYEDKEGKNKFTGAKT